MGTQSLVGDDRKAVAPRILWGAALALGAGAVKTGLAAAGTAVRVGGGVAARVVGSTPLQPRMQRLDDRWDQDRRDLLKRFDRSITSVVEILLNRIDLTQLIIERVDLNRIIEERVDVDGVIKRADVAGVARDVLDQIDLPEVIRNSSGTMAAETVESLRLRGMEADSSLSRLVDRVLHRSNGREAGPANPGRSLSGSSS